LQFICAFEHFVLLYVCFSEEMGKEGIDVAEEAIEETESKYLHLICTILCLFVYSH